jgi:hypothetical protein
MAFKIICEAAHLCDKFDCRKRKPHEPTRKDNHNSCYSLNIEDNKPEYNQITLKNYQSENVYEKFEHFCEDCSDYQQYKSENMRKPNSCTTFLCGSCKKIPGGLEEGMSLKSN